MPQTYSTTRYNAILGPQPFQTRSVSRYNAAQARRTRSRSIYDVPKAIRTRSVSRYNVFATKVMRGSANKYNSLVQEKRVVYARNTVTNVLTNLGELIPPATTLTDVNLPDGTYNIEVRSSLHFWDEARSRILFPIEIESGVIKVFNIPAIEGLLFTIRTDFLVKLTWSIPDGQFVSGLKFGVWTSATSPVDVSGTPDKTIEAYDNVGVYNVLFSQSVDTYYAVASFDDTDQGPESEIFVPWDTTPPESPKGQFIYNC